LPEIVLVASAASIGLYGTVLGSAMGSNILLMSLGLSIIVSIASTVLFIDGYQTLDGVLFATFFIAYTIFAFHGV